MHECMRSTTRFSVCFQTIGLLSSGLILLPLGRADTIPTLMPTAVSYSGTSFAFDSFSVSGSSFSFDGLSAGPISIPFFAEGQAIGLISIGFPAGFFQPPDYAPFGQITIGNETLTAVFSGSGEISTLTNDVIWPSGPNPSATVPALVQGTFSSCVSSSAPMCDPNFANPIANISIDLLGDIRFSLDSTSVLMTASFTSTPVPEPSGFLLAFIGFGIAAASVFRR